MKTKSEEIQHNSTELLNLGESTRPSAPIRARPPPTPTPPPPRTGHPDHSLVRVTDRFVSRNTAPTTCSAGVIARLSPVVTRVSARSDRPPRCCRRGHWRQLAPDSPFESVEAPRCSSDQVGLDVHRYVAGLCLPHRPEVEHCQTTTASSTAVTASTSAPRNFCRIRSTGTCP